MSHPDNQSQENAANTGAKRLPWTDYFVAQFEGALNRHEVEELVSPAESQFRLEDVFNSEECSSGAGHPSDAVLNYLTPTAPQIELSNEKSKDLFPAGNTQVGDQCPDANTEAKPQLLVLESAEPLGETPEEESCAAAVEPAASIGHSKLGIRLPGRLVIGATVIAMLLVATVSLKSTRHKRDLPVQAQRKIAPTSPVSQAPAGPPAELRAVHYGAESATVTITGQGPLKYEDHRLSSPNRIYFDFPNTNPVPQLIGKSMKFSDPFLAKIRIGEREPDTARVTLETGAYCDYSVSVSSNPDQLAITLRKHLPTP